MRFRPKRKAARSRDSKEERPEKPPRKRPAKAARKETPKAPAKRSGRARKRPRAERGRRRGSRIKAAVKRLRGLRPVPVAKQVAAGADRLARGADRLAREVGRRLSPPLVRRVARRVASALVLSLRLAVRYAFLTAAAVERATVTCLRLAAVPIAAATRAGARVLTPSRMAVAVAVAAFAVLAVSQFREYSGLAIGQPQYEGVTALATPPMAETSTPWSVHGPAVALLGLIALGGILAAQRGPTDQRRQGEGQRTRAAEEALGAGRRRSAVAAVAASGLAVAVVLAIDLPRGRDVGEVGDLYAGVEPMLLDGFYSQLAAVAVLTFVSALPFIWQIALPEPNRARKRT